MRNQTLKTDLVINFLSANKSPGSVYNLTRDAIGDNDDEGKFRRPQTPNSLKRNPIRKRRVRLNQLDVSTPEYPDAYDEDEEKDRDFSTRWDLWFLEGKLLVNS